MKNLLSNVRVLIPNMFPFSTSDQVGTGDISKDYEEIYHGDRDLSSILSTADQFSEQGIFQGGFFYPTIVSHEGPFTLEQSLNSLQSVQDFYSQQLVYRPGNLIEFYEYVSQGGKVVDNMIICGDGACTSLFQLINRDSEYLLLVIDKTEEATSVVELGGCVGIFVVAT